MHLIYISSGHPLFFFFFFFGLKSGHPLFAIAKDANNSFSIEQLYFPLQQIHIYGFSTSVGFEKCDKAMKCSWRIDVSLRAKFYCLTLHNKRPKLESVLQYISTNIFPNLRRRGRSKVRTIYPLCLMDMGQEIGDRTPRNYKIWPIMCVCIYIYIYIYIIGEAERNSN